MSEQKPAIESPDAITALPTIAEHTTQIPPMTQFNVLVEMANSVAASGLPLPPNCATPQAILTKFLLARELGISPMVGLHEIDLIEGKAAINARTMVALIRRRELGNIELVETNTDRAIVKAWRTDDPKKVHEFRFGQEEVERAELQHKKNHKKYPQSMRLARAVSLAAKALFQEVFLGVAYIPDELGVDTKEDGTPEFVDVTATEVSGIKRKTPDMITPDQVATVQEQVANVKDAIKEATALQKIVKAHAQTLALDSDQWQYILSRFRAEQKATHDELVTIGHFLQTVIQLRQMRKELNVTDEQWASAMTKRKVVVDIQLPVLDAVAIHTKLAESLTPFKRQEFGIDPPESRDTAGKD